MFMASFVSSFFFLLLSTLLYVVQYLPACIAVSFLQSLIILFFSFALEQVGGMTR